MKRYLLFTWVLGEPAGGMNDLEGQFDTLEEAKNRIVIRNYLKHYVYDTTEDKEYTVKDLFGE